MGTKWNYFVAISFTTVNLIENNHVKQSDCTHRGKEVALEMVKIACCDGMFLGRVGLLYLIHLKY